MKAAALQVVAVVVALLSAGLSAAYPGPHLSRRHTYCVAPTNSTICHCGNECHTFQFYLEHLERYFRDHTTFLFMRGKHTLAAGSYSTPWISNVTGLTLKGSHSLVPSPYQTWESSSQIRCNGTAGFTFENVKLLKLEYLTFIGCGWTSDSYVNATLYFNAVTNLIMSVVAVRNGRGWAMLAIDLGECTILDSTFANNTGSLQYQGGNMHVYNPVTPHCMYSGSSAMLHIKSSNFFYGFTVNNASGLTVVTQCINYAIMVEDSQFIRNRGGNVAMFLQLWKRTNIFTVQVIIQNCKISSGTAVMGGGLRMSMEEKPTPNVTTCSSKHLIQILNTTFTNNAAKHTGGGMYYVHLQNYESYCLSSKLTIHNCTFTHNTLLLNTVASGTALTVHNYLIPGYRSLGLPQALIEIQDCVFSQNYGGQDNVMSAALYVLQESSVNVSNSKFLYNECTAIAAVSAEVVFAGNIIIQGNQGYNGGGIVLCDRSHIYFTPYTSMLLAENTARGKGGAIYAADNCVQEETACFFQVATDYQLLPLVLGTVNVTLCNNDADTAGTAVYGGSIDYCYLFYPMGPEQYHEYSPKVVFNTIFRPNHSVTDTSFISSDPVGVCFCNDSGMPVCNKKSKNAFIYPGQTLQVSVVTVGQRNGTVPGTVVAIVTSPNVRISKHLQLIPSSKCSALNYTIKSNESSANIQLNIRPANDYYKLPVINVSFRECPLGFTLVNKTCKCHVPSRDFKISCDINSPSEPTILRHAPEWIGYDNVTNRILYYRYCPLDYCKPYDVNIPTDNMTFNQDAQCASSRTGIMCGQCGANLSLMLNSDNCGECSSFYLLLLNVYTLVGLLLVILISACNLTVTDGTINGLIFYANIVQLSITIYFPAPYKQTSLTGILTVLIAWLNLDLGIETCFYNGLDVYAKTWLQFAFPCYLLVIAGVIVCLSRRITFFARLIRRNGVQVLATLLYLSYAKLLQAVIVALTCGYVFHSDGSKIVVWVYDGNLKYLHGKHIPLFAVAVMFGLTSQPFVFLLLFIKYFQRMSNRKLLFWVHRLKPFIDAYTGPYKDESRFWTGLLLFVRDFLFIGHALNVTGAAQMNLTLTVLTCFLLLWTFWLINGGPYKMKKLNVLESLFILNLGVLCIGTFYFLDQKSQSNRRLFASAMISIAILQFLVFVLHRGYKSLRSSPVCRRVMWWATTVRFPEPVQEPVMVARTEDETSRGSVQGTGTQMIRCCRAYDQYRESLLASDDSDTEIHTQ